MCGAADVPVKLAPSTVEGLLDNRLDLDKEVLRTRQTTSRRVAPTRDAARSSTTRRLLGKQAYRKPVRRRVPARSDLVVDRPQELRNALAASQNPTTSAWTASAAVSWTSARRTSSAPTSWMGVEVQRTESNHAFSALTACGQAARSAARCVNGGSLPSTSTSGRLDACMTRHSAGTAGCLPFSAAPCQVRPVVTRGP